MNAAQLKFDFACKSNAKKTRAEVNERIRQANERFKRHVRVGPPLCAICGERHEINWDALSNFAAIRLQIEQVWNVASKPIKFPSPQRRRREDREIPKAA